VRLPWSSSRREPTAPRKTVRVTHASAAFSRGCGSLQVIAALLFFYCMNRCPKSNHGQDWGVLLM
jgi:hypothetical protein